MDFKKFQVLSLGQLIERLLTVVVCSGSLGISQEKNWSCDLAGYSCAARRVSTPKNDGIRNDITLLTDVNERLVSLPSCTKFS